MSDLDYWSRLKKLGIMSLQRRREKLIIIMTFKIKNNLIPNDINLEFKEHKHKSHTIAVLKPLPRVKGKLLTIFENSFLIKSAKLWNKLPQQLTKIPNLHLFEKQLDKYLCLIPDTPPVHGYPHNSRNSILDYSPVSYDKVTSKSSSK